MLFALCAFHEIRFWQIYSLRRRISSRRRSKAYETYSLTSSRSPEYCRRGKHTKCTLPVISSRKSPAESTRNVLSHFADERVAIERSDRSSVWDRRNEVCLPAASVARVYLRRLHQRIVPLPIRFVPLDELADALRDRLRGLVPDSPRLPPPQRHACDRRRPPGRTHARLPTQAQPGPERLRSTPEWKCYLNSRCSPRPHQQSHSSTASGWRPPRRRRR